MALVATTAVLASYGLTAANTVPASKAGDGTGTISGYTVSGIDYTLLSSDPAKIDKVDFTLDTAPGAGSTLKAKIGGSWYDCTNTGTAATCDFAAGSEPTVSAATSLQVVIAD